MGYLDKLKSLFRPKAKPQPYNSAVAPVQPEEDILEALPATPADQWAYSGTELFLASSWVDSVRYFWNERILEVVFKRKNGLGAVVQYNDVEPELAKGFYDTDSPGRYVWRHFYHRDYVLLAGVTPYVSPKSNVIRPRPDLAGQQLPEGIVPQYLK